jgi:hypothetical protein
MNLKTSPRHEWRTWGDAHPHLRDDPRFAALAARPYPSATTTGERPTAPGLLSMAGSLLRAGLAHLGNHAEIASEDVRAERKRICLACPLHDPERDSCRECGCHLPLKRAWASSSCPLSPPRWGAV